MWELWLWRFVDFTLIVGAAYHYQRSRQDEGSLRDLFYAILLVAIAAIQTGG